MFVSRTKLDSVKSELCFAEDTITLLRQTAEEATNRADVAIAENLELQAAIRTATAELDAWEKSLTEYKATLGRALEDHTALLETCAAVEQTLGKVLGYPEAYPEVSDVDNGNVEVGDHTPETIAEEAAKKITTLREALETERAASVAARPAAPTISAEEFEFVGKVRARATGGTIPVKSDTLRALIALIDRLPRA